MRLTDCEIGKMVLVANLDCEPKIRKHLIDLGITINTKIMIKKIAPLKDPIEIWVRGYTLSLRYNEVNSILVKEVI